MIYRALGPILLFSLLSSCTGLTVESPAVSPEIRPIPMPMPQVTYTIEEPEKDFWQQLAMGFEFQSQYTRPRVLKSRRYLESNPNYLAQLSGGIERYLPYIVERVQEQNLPLELAVMPIIESGLDPYAFSPGAAAGLWQFVPGTARHYGLTIDWWLDQRRDPVESTEAALTYLNDLHRQFGDWLLAMAAYNCGAGNVRKAIRKAGSRDFWKLDLPRETSIYVPRIIALAAIIKNAQNTSMQMPEVDPAIYFRQIDIGSQVDVAQMAKRVQLTVESLYALNPGLNRWATHPDGPYRLLVPAEDTNRIVQVMKEMPISERLNWTRYQIQPGDSLSDIAQRFHTSVAAIQRSNRLKGHRIRTGDALLIASADAQGRETPVDNPLLAARGSSFSYKVRAGDSLWSIGKEFGVGVSTLARYNRLDTKVPLRAGRLLKVPQKHAMKKVVYRVRQGDSLSAIAARFKLSISDILTWNRLQASNYLQPGQTLILRVNLLGS